MTIFRKYTLDIAAFVWGLAEATLFFVVPDVLLSYIGLKRGVRGSVRASLIAAIGASIGGVAMYLWSAQSSDALHAVLEVPAISDAMAARALSDMRDNWFVATLFGPFTSTPFKMFAVLAPAADVPVGVFALAAIAARLPRFLLISIGVALAGRGLARWLTDSQRLWLLIGAWLLFYAVFFTLMPN